MARRRATAKYLTENLAGMALAEIPTHAGEWSSETWATFALDIIQGLQAIAGYGEADKRAAIADYSPGDFFTDGH